MLLQSYILPRSTRGSRDCPLHQSSQKNKSIALAEPQNKQSLGLPLDPNRVSANRKASMTINRCFVHHLARRANTYWPVNWPQLER
jgi:hypothetical protein